MFWGEICKFEHSWISLISGLFLLLLFRVEFLSAIVYIFQFHKLFIFDVSLPLLFKYLDCMVRLLCPYETEESFWVSTLFFKFFAKSFIYVLWFLLLVVFPFSADVALILELLSSVLLLFELKDLRKCLSKFVSFQLYSKYLSFLIPCQQQNMNHL